MKIVEVSNLSFQVLNEEKKVNILSDISFSIQKGEFVGMIGHNGSGKSTLALCLCGLKKISSGKINLFEKKIKSQEDLIKNVGIVFQNPENQFIRQTVEENIAFALESDNLSKEVMKQKIDFSLSLLDIENLKKVEASNLSGGQKQKAAIAEKIAKDQEIIIFDEVLSQVDNNSKKEILEKLHLLNKKGKTIIYITHDISELSNVDKIIHLEKGKISFTGTLNKFLEKNSEFDNFETYISRNLFKKPIVDFDKLKHEIKIK